MAPPTSVIQCLSAASHIFSKLVVAVQGESKLHAKRGQTDSDVLDVSYFIITESVPRTSLSSAICD